MRITLVLLTLALGACFSPKYTDGSLHCTPNPNDPRPGQGTCPDGYHCAVTNTCWALGHNPPRPPAHFTAAGGGAVNVSAPMTHAATLSVGQPLATTAQAAGDHTIQFGLLRDAVSK
jgi:hypothetical protein